MSNGSFIHLIIPQICLNESRLLSLLHRRTDPVPPEAHGAVRPVGPSFTVIIFLRNKSGAERISYGRLQGLQQQQLGTESITPRSVDLKAFSITSLVISSMRLSAGLARCPELTPVYHQYVVLRPPHPSSALPSLS